jgi:hypothetical protein
VATSNGARHEGRSEGPEGRLVRVVEAIDLWEDGQAYDRWCRRWPEVEEAHGVGNKGYGVPLSEDEQRILQEIEQQFYETDPAFAREVGSTTLYRHAFRNLKYATLSFVAGVVLLIYTLITTSFVVSFVCGFLVMLASALWFEHNLRKLGRAGWQQMTASMRAHGLREAVGGAGRKVRDRFKRNKDE